MGVGGGRGRDEEEAGRARAPLFPLNPPYLTVTKLFSNAPDVTNCHTRGRTLWAG